MSNPTTSPQPNAPPIGLIAGQGELPLMVARGIRDANRSVACVALAGQHHPDLPQLCDHFATAGIIRLGRWIRLLNKWHAHEAIMVGRVKKARMYQPLRLLRQIPDLRAANLWYRVLRHDKRNAALLTAVADELASAGVTLVDSTTYIKNHLAAHGTLTTRQPTPAEQADADFAWPLAIKIAELHIGQALAVKEREIIAVEAIEGTDRMIRRAAELCPVGGWTLIKTAHPDQDMRFDVPTIGPNTIDNLKQHGGTAIVLQAGKVILADKTNLITRANIARIAITAR